MGHKKLVKFRAIETYRNVLQYPENIKGSWHTVFGNDNPITLELACGKGEYSVGLGRQYPDRNFLGVDIKGNRIYTGAKTALEEGLNNIAFLRTHISHITKYFNANDIEEIWIIFPDPFLKKESNRLTHARYLYLYEQILRPDGRINLKTDSKELYDFTLEVIAEQGCYVHENIADVYGQGKAIGPLAIQTFYEKMHLAEGRTIYFLSFSLPATGVKLTGRFNKEPLPEAMPILAMEQEEIKEGNTEEALEPA
ncbi:tRNA (guanosine(46)-N7)-methyltransferase TrmB [Nemorincola caseinilytica]|uniref:tRNA (guanine-N(7)-)-methyltransferase n=1 Tax=Nemorincola caseinilytica TaxID=2054315 RepID=A0ABP8N2L2_9BACT